VRLISDITLDLLFRFVRFFGGRSLVNTAFLALFQSFHDREQFFKFSSLLAATLYLIFSYSWFGQQVINEVNLTYNKYTFHFIINYPGTERYTIRKYE
jgi:hypothetical protein